MTSKHWLIALGVLALSAAAAATQVSILRLGTESYGSTVLVLRTGDLASLKFIDTAEAACERQGDSAQLFGSTFLCEGDLALKILEEGRALLRWNVKGA